MSKRASARVASKRAFARVHPQLGLVAHSPEVLGMAHCLDSSTQRGRSFGAYCFKLSFTPVAVIANAIAHPDDDEFGPILYTAAGVKLSSRLRMSAPFEWTNRGNAPYRGPPANAQRGRRRDELGQKRVWTQLGRQLGQKRVWAWQPLLDRGRAVNARAPSGFYLALRATPWST